MNEQRSRRALHEVYEIFDRHDLIVWLDCGTVLGAYRSGRFISWDNDIDLGVWAVDLDKIDTDKLWSDLNDAGFDIYELPDKLCIERNGIPINVSLFHRQDDSAIRDTYLATANFGGVILKAIWWACRANRKSSAAKVALPVHPVSLGKRLLTAAASVLLRRRRDAWLSRVHRWCLRAGCRPVHWRVPVHFLVKPDSLEFYGDPWPVPNNLEAYLEFRFGPDWRIPRRDFSTLEHDGAVAR